jgi:hypothetical protein
MCAAVNMNGVSWNVKTWNWIVKHVGMRLQFVPSILRNSITTLPAMNESKIKWPMNEHVGMSQVDIFPIRKEMMLVSIGFRGIGRSDVMSMSQRRRPNDVIAMMILKPEPFVDSVVPRIRWVGNVKINQVVPINKTGQIERHRCLKGHTDQTLLANITRTDRVRYEEEPIVTRDDPLSQYVCGRNFRCGVRRCRRWWACVESWEYNHLIIIWIVKEIWVRCPATWE